jgi:cytochrome c-type biogenesis protein CcmH/NrfG
MTSRKKRDARSYAKARTVTGCFFMAVWFLISMSCETVVAAQPTPTDAAVAATLKRDAERCRTRLDLDACYDAIRRDPRDVTLVVALGDALARAKRPADALRSYRHAEELAPKTPGLAAKIDAVDGTLQAKRAGRNVPVDRAAADRVAVRRFTNAAPEGQSH